MMAVANLASTLWSVPVMHLLTIFLIIIVVLFGLMRLGKGTRPGEQPAAQAGVTVSGVAPKPDEATAGGDLLCDEPLVAEFGCLVLAITLTIDPSREADLQTLRGYGAIEEGAFVDDWPVLRFEAIPPALLLQRFPQIASVQCFSAILRDEGGAALQHYHGTWPQIRARLRAFAETPAGFREVAQERGDLAEGRYFTENLFICIDRYPQWRLRVSSLSREHLRAGIEAQIAWLEGCFTAGRAAGEVPRPFSGG